MAGIAAPKFQIGDLVWAKMKGFPPWPGKLVDPSTTTLKPPGNVGKSKLNHCVYFFGSNNFGWLTEESIKPYQEFKEQNIKLTKSKGFKDAVNVIEEYIKNGCPDNFPPSAASIDDVGDGLSQSSSLPSIDEDIATIFQDGEGRGDTGSQKTSAAKSASQRDYSRKPFTSKPRKAPAAATTNNSHGDEEPSPVKRNRSSSTEDANASAAAAAKSNAKVGARNIIARTSQYLLDSNSGSTNQNELDVGQVSAKAKTIRPSSLKFGFIGLGTMGQRLVKNLINSGHSVTIWNRTLSKTKDFIKVGASKAITPGEVVAQSDITFSCLSDPHAVKEVVFGNCGVLQEIKSGKGYVEMTTIDADTSNDISEAIVARGGRYLEAPVIGAGKQQAEEGNLTVIVSGDKSLFDESNSCFQAIAQHTFYLGGQIGDASKMALVVSMLTGNLIASLAESMALADRTGLSQKDLLEILSLSPLNCQTILSKGRAMIDGGFATEMPLTHMQKDLRLALQLGEVFEHPLPITASTNEVFKHAKHLGYSDHDVAAVYIRSRF